MGVTGAGTQPLTAVLRLPRRVQENSVVLACGPKTRAILTSGQALDRQSLVSEESHVFQRAARGFVCLVMGSELGQGNETLHRPHKLYVHLQDSGVRDRKHIQLCQLSVGGPTGRVPAPVLHPWQSGLTDKQGSVPCPRDPRASALCPSVSWEKEE